MKSQERVLLTGASGTMGYEAFLELMRRRGRYKTRLLLLPSRRHRALFSKFKRNPDLEIVWGDLTRAEDVRSAVEGIDCVLHAAALVSPAADKVPELARRVNVGGMANLIEAIRRQAREVRVVAVGSVAQYGDRLPPAHWIRVGDPLMPSFLDYYALTKCESERLLVEAGLKRWASLRLTFIAGANLIGQLDPIAFHQPLAQAFEIITPRDAGYGLVQCLDAPEDFWCHIYNMSGGPACRTRYFEFLTRALEVYGIPSLRHVTERNWFALRGFHGGYFEDSATLNSFTRHFRDSLDDYFKQIEENAPRWLRLGASISPNRLTRAYLRRLVDPLRWIEQDDRARIEAFLGSREAWEANRSWDAPGLEPEPTIAEQPRREAPQLSNVEGYAASRGGRCLSPNHSKPKALLQWECARKHRFSASPMLLIGGGYWCPHCAPSFEDPSGWNYMRAAEQDPALAALYRKALDDPASS